MTKFESRPSLLRALRDSANKELTSKEVYRQRVSFIMGSLKPESGVTRSRVEDVLEKQEGKTSDPVRVNGQ